MYKPVTGVKFRFKSLSRWEIFSTAVTYIVVNKICIYLPHRLLKVKVMGHANAQHTGSDPDLSSKISWCQ